MKVKQILIFNLHVCVCTYMCVVVSMALGVGPYLLPWLIAAWCFRLGGLQAPKAPSISLCLLSPTPTLEYWDRTHSPTAPGFYVGPRNPDSDLKAFKESPLSLEPFPSLKLRHFRGQRNDSEVKTLGLFQRIQAQFPIIHVQQFAAAYNSSSRESNTLFWPPWAPV